MHVQTTVVQYNCSHVGGYWPDIPDFLSVRKVIEQVCNHAQYRGGGQTYVNRSRLQHEEKKENFKVKVNVATAAGTSLRCFIATVTLPETVNSQ